jgi:uncharacterized protein YybS (DUF2232 family)
VNEEGGSDCDGEMLCNNGGVENPMTELGKILVIVGVILTLVGLLIWAGVGKDWIGRLPGDIHYTKGNFTFYFPLATAILVSILLTLLLWIFRR